MSNIDFPTSLPSVASPANFENAERKEEIAVAVAGEFFKKDSSPSPVLEKPVVRRGRKPKHTLDVFKQKIHDEGADINDIHVQTFHFHFSEELTERFTYFATLHRFDERKTFKESWAKWIAEEDVANCIAGEIELLTAEGYKGDILDKMFKSVRYYYRKKPFEPDPPKTRKTYESISKEILQSMDAHIIAQIKYSETNNVPLVSPAKAYTDYIEKQGDNKQTGDLKHKKTYKNRFFLFTKNIRAYYS